MLQGSADTRGMFNRYQVSSTIGHLFQWFGVPFSEAPASKTWDPYNKFKTCGVYLIPKVPRMLVEIPGTSDDGKVCSMGSNPSGWGPIKLSLEMRVEVCSTSCASEVQI